MDLGKWCRAYLSRVDYHRLLLFGVDMDAQKIQGKQIGRLLFPDAGIRRTIELSTFRGSDDSQHLGRHWIGGSRNLSRKQATPIGTTIKVFYFDDSKTNYPYSLSLYLVGL